MDQPRHMLTVIAVSDVERSARFYEQAFGWKRGADFPVYVEFRTPEGRGVGLYERETYATHTGGAPTVPPPGGVSPVELYLWCDDAHAAVDRALGAGARLLSAVAPRNWGDETGYVADPDGTVIALAKVPEPE
ncbi:MAG: VOC family protein [Planctomycetota bacterium]